MGDDWQIGDLALCIGQGEWWQVTGDCFPEKMPRLGGIYTVSLIETFCENLFLEFEDLIGSYEAAVFKRIRPLSDEEQRQAIEEMRGPEVVEA